MIRTHRHRTTSLAARQWQLFDHTTAVHKHTH